MADKRKAQPAGAGRAVGNTVDAGGVDSAFDQLHSNTKPSVCQVTTDGESFRAAMPQHIGDKLAEAFRNVEQRAKGDGTGEPENGAFGEACEYGRPIAWTDVYVKMKVAFRQKALRLLKGPKLSCFICIGLHIDGKGECYPSIDTIVRETGYSRATVCRALEELVELGFIEKKRRKGETTLYAVKGYVWYGSKSKPTLLGEAQSKETVLSPPESKASERLPTKRLATLPKDEPSVKEQPLEKKERERFRIRSLPLRLFQLKAAVTTTSLKAHSSSLQSKTCPPSLGTRMSKATLRRQGGCGGTRPRWRKKSSWRLCGRRSASQPGSGRKAK